MEQYEIVYELAGSINGTSILGAGKGLADFASGTYELEVTFERVPLHWDPVFIILMTCDRFMGVCAKEEGGALNIFSLSSGDHLMQWGREGAVYDDHDHEAGYFRSLSTGHADGHRIISRSQILTAHFHMHIGEEVTEIATPVQGVMMPYRDDMVLVTTAYGFSTNIGANYNGYTFYPYTIPSKRTLPTLQALSMDSIEFSRVARPLWGRTVRFRVGSSVRRLQVNKEVSAKTVTG